MKSFIIFSCLVALVFAETYSTENDNFDVDGLLNNEKELTAFVNCFLGKGPCNEVATAFKKDIPESFAEACAKCNDTQKNMMKRFLEALKEKRPEDFQAFKQTFDPEGKYYSNLEAALSRV